MLDSVAVVFLPHEQERTISKTQLEAWRLCQRKWGWRYLAKIDRSNRFATLGTRVHSQLEGWLRHARLPDPNLEEGKIAEAGLHLIPEPQTPDLLVEVEIFTITEQAIYRGFADWLEPLVVPVVGDHKSTVNFRWALQPEELHEDIQANIYARAGMQYTKSDTALAKWVYYRTRGAAKAKSVEQVMERSRVDDFFGETIDPIAAEIQACREEAPDVLQLEVNARACSMYGGCPYRENCNLDAKERFLSLMAKESLLAQMKKKAEATKNEPKDETPADEEVEDAAKASSEINPPEGGPEESLKDRMKRMAVKSSKKGSSTASDKKTTTKPPKAAKAKKRASGFILCYGAVPLTGLDFVHASEIIAAVKAQMCDELGLADYRLVDFNKGPAMLAAGVRQALDDEPPTGYVFLDNRVDEGRHTYTAFAEAAAAVIRGL